MKKFLKHAIKYIITFIVMILLFMLCLTISSSFSSGYIKENIKESAEILKGETNSKEVPILYKGIDINFDNYTDALMLNTAYSIDSTTPLYSAFVARKNYIPNETTQIIEEKPGELGFSSNYTERDQVGELNDTVNGKVIESFEYTRYWHGYLIIIRPLLLLFNVSTIRVIFVIMFIILAIILLYYINKKINLITAIIFLIGLIWIEYFYIGISLQGAFVFFIMMVSSILLLTRFEKIKSIPFMFFIIGMLTNFFDFLTVPILTFGFPLILYLLLSREKSLKKNFINILLIALAWGIGYALTWISKWLLTYLIFNKNLFETIWQQIVYRSVGGEDIGYADVLLSNLSYVLGGILLEILAIFVFVTLNSKKLKIHFEKKSILYLLISLVPFIWYLVLENHSYYHSLFTYRNLLLTIIGVSIFILNIVYNSEKEEKS